MKLKELLNSDVLREKSVVIDFCKFNKDKECSFVISDAEELSCIMELKDKIEKKDNGAHVMVCTYSAKSVFGEIYSDNVWIYTTLLKEDIEIMIKNSNCEEPYLIDCVTKKELEEVEIFDYKKELLELDEFHTIFSIFWD